MSKRSIHEISESARLTRHSTDLGGSQPKLAQSSLRFGCESISGLKSEQEDRIGTPQWLPGIGTLFAVYDGHGGSACADFVQSRLPKEIENAIRRRSGRSTWDALERFRVKRKRQAKQRESFKEEDGSEKDMDKSERMDSLRQQIELLCTQKQSVHSLIVSSEQSALDAEPLRNTMQELDQMMETLQGELVALEDDEDVAEAEEGEDDASVGGVTVSYDDDDYSLNRTDTEPITPSGEAPGVTPKVVEESPKEGSDAANSPEQSDAESDDNVEDDESTERLCGLLSEQLITSACTEAFKTTDKRFLQHAAHKRLRDGTTACVCLVHGSFSPLEESCSSARLVVANCGDCRAVLCRGGKAVALSDDHKPNRPDERKRIEASGGHVVKVQGVWRATNPAGAGFGVSSSRLSLYLAVSRAFGDAQLKQSSHIVTAVPEVRIEMLQPNDLFLVIACDGIWDVMSNQEAIDIAAEHWGSPEEASKAIVRTAFTKGSADNLSALVIQFEWQESHAERILSEAKQATEQPAASVVPKEGASEEIDMFG